MDKKVSEEKMMDDLVKIFTLISNRYSNIKSQIPVWDLTKPITELEAGEMKPLGTNIKFYTMDTRSESKIAQDVKEDLEWLKNIPFNTDAPNKKYTEGEMKMALTYQWASKEPVSIEQIDKMLNELGTNE